MNKYHIGAVICLILAIVCFAAAVATGQAAVHLFLIFPVLISQNSALTGLGALFIILTFILFFFGFASGYEVVGWDEFQREYKGHPREKPGPEQGGKEGKRKVDVQGGGVVLIGPIPIIFGSNQKLTIVLVVLALAIMIVALLFFLLL